MATAANKPLIVQSDCSILLEVNAQHADAARAALAPFAELVKSPEQSTGIGSRRSPFGTRGQRAWRPIRWLQPYGARPLPGATER